LLLSLVIAAVDVSCGFKHGLYGTLLLEPAVLGDGDALGLLLLRGDAGASWGSPGRSG